MNLSLGSTVADQTLQGSLDLPPGSIQSLCLHSLCHRFLVQEVSWLQLYPLHCLWPPPPTCPSPLPLPCHLPWWVLISPSTQRTWSTTCRRTPNLSTTTTSALEPSSTTQILSSLILTAPTWKNRPPITSMAHLWHYHIHSASSQGVWRSHSSTSTHHHLSLSCSPRLLDANRGTRWAHWLLPPHPPPPARLHFQDLLRIPTQHLPRSRW